MQYDLTEEHSIAYDGPLCNTINDITNLFDEILDYLVPAMYPYMACVDVFPCESHPSQDIPKYIQKYFGESCHGDEYKEPMQSKYDFELILEEPQEGDLCTVLGGIFSNSLVTRKHADITQEQLRIRVENVSNKLKQITGVETAIRYSINGKSLRILQEQYIGILTAGYVLSCGGYSIMILIGTNE